MIFISKVRNQRSNYLAAFYSKQEWNSVAPAWQKWWRTIERGTEGVSRRLVELARIKPGSRVLDIATGMGEPALTAQIWWVRVVTYWQQIFRHRC